MWEQSVIEAVFLIQSFDGFRDNFHVYLQTLPLPSKYSLKTSFPASCGICRTPFSITGFIYICLGSKSVAVILNLLVCLS